ncbi:MAG: hypothetical protein GX621_12840, partial [Pirellulaceae bacterium]|nr:hypothetical protein [Pirellulaceae bacterium]
MTTIIEHVHALAAAERAELLDQYRRLLTDDGADPEALRQTAERLGFDLARLGADRTAVAEAERLSRLAGTLADARSDAGKAHEAAERHRVKLRTTIAKLEAEQAALDAKAGEARWRVTVVEDAAKRRAAILAESPDLFSDELAQRDTAEHARLQGLADELPAIRRELDAVQTELVEARAAFDDAVDAVHVDRSDEAIAAKDAARRRVVELSERGLRLHEHLDEAQIAARDLETAAG